MTFKAIKSKAIAIESSALIKFCAVDGLKKDALIKELDKLSCGLISQAFDSGEFSGKKKEFIVLHRFPGIAADRLILVGLGALKSATAESYRIGAGVISTIAAIKNSDRLTAFLNQDEETEYASAIIEGFNLGKFKMLDYKTGEEDKYKINEFSIAIDDRRIKSLEKAVSKGEIVSDAVVLARRLTNHPGSYLTPKKFASVIQKLGKKYSFETKVLDEKQIKSEKMGALWAVAKGSAEPPRFAIMKYMGGSPKTKPVVLVGKGITFDAGGISLKPGLNMGEMKGDMQGASVVTSAMTAVARLGLKINLIGLVPMAENLPSGRALKPGDIVTARNGKTIEIINTDAEGRLILADALDYANEFDPQAVFDIATLTGAAKYILGTGGVPIMGNNKKAIQALYEASDRCGEKVWELPIWDIYHKRMESPIADLQNSGGAEAGTLTAAAFLEEFIGNWPWTHIDIAAVDVEKQGQPYIPIGISAIGLRLLVDMLANWRKI